MTQTSPSIHSIRVRHLFEKFLKLEKANRNKKIDEPAIIVTTPTAPSPVAQSSDLQKDPEKPPKEDAKPVDTQLQAKQPATKIERLTTRDLE